MALSTDDVVEVQQLLSAYCHHMDAGDGAGVAGLFTADGVLEIVDVATSTGADEITANCAFFPQVLPGGRHIVQNVWVDGDGDRAVVRAYLLNAVAGDRPEMRQTGVYRDDVVRTDDGWRFAHRVLTLDGPLF